MNNTNNQDGSNNNNGNNNNQNTVTGADIPLLLKARYFSSGVVVGVFLSPVVRNALSKLQPKFEGIMDTLTGQAEGLVEKGSDLMAKAKDALNKESAATPHDHAGHSHETPAGNA